MDTRSFVMLLQLMSTSGIGQKTLEKIIVRIKDEGIDLGDFAGLTLSDQAVIVQLKPELLEQAAAKREEAIFLSDTLRERDIEVLIKGDENYPEHLTAILGDRAPFALFVQGNLKILRLSAVGFCGSRKASAKGLDIASKCADALAPEDVNIVSGYAHGVDLAAHRSALACGGKTTFVLAEGILHFQMKREVGEFITERNHVVISEFSPRLPWAVHNAMQRNRTICGLSDALILIEAGLTGGTFEAGKAALELHIPLFAVNYSDPPKSAEGNDYFLQRGASALQTTSEGTPSLDKIWSILASKNSKQPSDRLSNHSTSIYGDNSNSDHVDQQQLKLWDE